MNKHVYDIQVEFLYDTNCINCDGYNFYHRIRVFIKLEKLIEYIYYYFFLFILKLTSYKFSENDY